MSDNCKIVGLDFKEITGKYILKGSYINRFGLQRYFAQMLCKSMQDVSILIETLRRLANLLEEDVKEHKDLKPKD